MSREHHAIDDFIHQFRPATTAQEQGWLADKTPPTLLLLHGTGGTENDLLELGQRLYPGAALLSPRGKVLENGMPRFFRRLAEGIFDIPDLKLRTHELADFVSVAAQHYHFDAGRIIAVGYSNGANIAASMLLLRPGILAGAILFRPMVPLEPELAPDLDGTPIFISAGRTDPLIQVSETERLIRLLQHCKADVTTFWQPGGHALNRDDLREAQTWLADHFQTLALE